MQFYNTLIDKTSESGIVYIGKSLPGSREDAEVWSIKKIVTTGIIPIKYAQGSSLFTHKWSDRLNLSYS